MLFYRVPLPGFKLTTLVMIGTDCTVVLNSTTIRSQPRRYFNKITNDEILFPILILMSSTTEQDKYRNVHMLSGIHEQAKYRYLHVVSRSHERN
jgi:hypothetical protein